MIIYSSFNRFTESSNERRQFQDKLEDTSSGIGKMINGIAHMLGDGDVVPGGPDGEESEDDDDPTESGASIYNHPLPWMAFHHPPYSPYAPPYAGYHVPPYAGYPGPGYAYHQPAVTTTYHHPSTAYHAPPFPATLLAALPSFSGVPSGLPSGYGYQAVPWGYKLVEPGPVATHFEYHHGDVAPATPAPEPVKNMLFCNYSILKWRAKEVLSLDSGQRTGCSTTLEQGLAKDLVVLFIYENGQFLDLSIL